MTDAQAPRETLLTRRREMALGLGVVVVVVAIVALVPAVLFGALLLVVSRVPSSGTALDVDRARRVVAEHRRTLDQVVVLAQQRPLPASDDFACRALAEKLGALEIRFHGEREDAPAIVVYSRGGLPEVYESQLTWLSAATAARVHAGEYRPGEDFAHIDGGWWWVFW